MSLVESRTVVRKSVTQTTYPNEVADPLLWNWPSLSLKKSLMTHPYDLHDALFWRWPALRDDTTRAITKVKEAQRSMLAPTSHPFLNNTLVWRWPELARSTHHPFFHPYNTNDALFWRWPYLLGEDAANFLYKVELNRLKNMLKPIEPQPHQPIVQGYDNYLLLLTPEQEATLENEFARTKSIHEADLAILAAQIGLNERDAQIWYTRRLAAWRHEQGLSDNFGTL